MFVCVCVCVCLCVCACVCLCVMCVYVVPAAEGIGGVTVTGVTGGGGSADRGDVCTDAAELNRA